MRILRRLRLRRRVRFFFHLARMLRQGAFGMSGVDASAAVPGVPIAAALEEYRGARASEWPAPAD